MNREQAIAEIRASWRRLYPTDGKGKGIVCPLCGSGSGIHGTGITGDSNHGKPNSLKCWSCDFSGDVIDLIQRDRNTDFKGALNIAADSLGIKIDAYSPTNTDSDKITRENKKDPQTAMETPVKSINLMSYYAECTARLKDPGALSYLAARGISTETAELYNIGFDPAADPAQSGHKTPRLIIPTTASHYIARSIDANTPKEYAKMNNKGGKPGIFNINALYDSTEAVFVTEGVFDALSILEIGADAIALNSTSNVDLLLKALEQKTTAATLILCLDNDEPGKRATEALNKGLNRLNISNIIADISGACKDPNEALTKDKAAFIESVNKARAKTAIKPDNVSDYINLLMHDEIEHLKGATERQTGFTELDRLSGGLYPGLYVIAATSSLGKTTFCGQIADNLASTGHDVLFFTLEQSRLELVSKSLARLTAIEDIETAVTSLNIRKGISGANVTRAINKYKSDIGDRLSIIEGNFNCNISFIGDYVRRYVKQNSCKPIIFIDYLQILQPADDTRRTTTKETIDNTVTELKRISREHDLTVFIISSVNRANYLSPIDFESLKESGGIEYTADVIWGLQLQCLNDPLFSEDKKIKEKRLKIRQEKAANPRKIELLCLKNRYGISNYSCGFDYYPSNDLFVQPTPGEFNPSYGTDPYRNIKRI